LRCPSNGFNAAFHLGFCSVGVCLSSCKASITGRHREAMVRTLLMSFTKHQLDQSWERMATTDYWFVPKGPDGKPRIGPANLAALVFPVLEQEFVLDGVGDRLMAWKRKGR
jgi:hypothetical protein